MSTEKKSAKKVVDENRLKIVNKLIENMKKGYLFSEWAWNRSAFIPRNAVTGASYQGINRINLAMTAIEKNYEDPRWLTYKKATEMGYKIKPKEKGTLCEKWIWQKKEKAINKETGEPELDEEGNEKFIEVELKQPIINYFYLFNASQIEGLEELKEDTLQFENSDIINVADSFIKSSECPIEESFQEKAYYSPLEDKIVLPLRKFFKSDEAFLGTLLHEMSHSTGSEERLNREIINNFGTEKYAIEELTAELSCVFLEADLGLDIDFTRQDHVNYFSSWIKALTDNPNELYKVCANASKASEYLMDNFEKEKIKEKELLDIEDEEAI